MSSTVLKWSMLSSAAVVVVAAGLFIYIYLWPDKPVELVDPAPSGAFSLTPIRVVADPYKLVEGPKAEGDGAADVQQALKSYYEKEQEVAGDSSRSADLKGQINTLYSKYDSITADTVPPWRCAELLEASAEKGGFNFEKSLSPEDLEWVQPRRLCWALDKIAKTALIEGRIAEKQGDRAHAEKIFKAVLFMGVRLAYNKARVWIQREGLEAQRGAAYSLLLLYDAAQQPDKKLLAGDYLESVRRTQKKADECFMNLTQLFRKWPAGDLIQFARRHEDPAWRAEAVLTIGLCRWTADGNRYVGQLNRCLNQAANDPDPNVARAAVWAKGVTRETFTEQERKLHGGE